MATATQNTTAPGAPATNACDHCGDDCGREPIRWQEHRFCCEGCRGVYALLNESGLGNYYRLEQRAGTSRRAEAGRYDWLDDETTARRLLDFAEADRAQISLSLPQIHCSACIYLLENLNRLHEGVLRTRVNFMQRRATVLFDPREISLRTLVELLDRIGYAPELRLAGLAEGANKVKVDRTLSYQLGLAGFAFGNIMLLSFPEYLGLEDGLGDTFFRQVLGYLNVGLAIPVLLYSGRDYLRDGWTTIRQRRLGVDIPIALGMIVLFVRSAYEIFTQTGAGFLDSLAGLVFFLLIGKWFQRATYERLSFERDYRSYFPMAATVVRQGREQSLALDKLQVGDTLLVRNGELIPADGILKRGRAQVDYSFVTGESEAVNKEAGSTLYAGGRLVGESVEIVVDKLPDASYFTQLWQDQAFQAGSDKGHRAWVDRVSRYFTPTILAISVLTLLYWLPRDVEIAINSFTAVLIIACPCALALAAPFALGTLLRELGRRGLYLKDPRAAERLAGVDTVVFDKTGTLTTTAGGTAAWLGTPLTDEEQRALIALTAQSNHPISRGIQETLGTGTHLPELHGYEEITGRGLRAVMDGRLYTLGSAAFLNLEEVPDGLRDTGVLLAIDGELRGGFRIRQAYRSGLAAVLAAVRERARIFLLSGDNEREQANLAPFFPENDSLLFHQKPMDKLRFVRGLRAGNRRVLMLGDGLNDAGALKESDVGIVLSEDTNNFNPACDGILKGDAFADLPRLLRGVRRTRYVTGVAYAMAGAYNVVGLSFAVQGLLSPVIAAIFMPVSSVTVAGVAALGVLWVMRR